jgi:hypothetical protein
MTIDLTGVLVALIGGVFSVVTLVVGAWINARMKDSAASATLGAAVKNSLGAMQRASEAAVLDAHPSVRVPGVPAELQVPVQYVLDHAGPEAARFGITPFDIAGKVDAQIGLAAIATNQAVAASPSPLVPPPLGPVPLNPTGRT